MDVVIISTWILELYKRSSTVSWSAVKENMPNSAVLQQVLLIMGKKSIQTIKSDFTNSNLYLKGFCLDEAQPVWMEICVHWAGKGKLLWSSNDC